MQFPSQNQPYLQFDGRNGQFRFGAGGQKTDIDIVGKPLGVDIANAKQGWLAFTGGGVDWQELAEQDKWGVQPSDEYKPGVEVEVTAPDVLGDSTPMRFRGSTMAHNKLIAAIHDRTAADAKRLGSIPVIKIVKINTVKVGAGTSVNFDFEVAPTGAWLRRGSDGSIVPPNQGAVGGDDFGFDFGN